MPQSSDLGIPLVGGSDKRNKYLKWLIIALWITLIILCFIFKDDIIPKLLDILEWVSIQ